MLTTGSRKTLHMGKLGQSMFHTLGPAPSGPGPVSPLLTSLVHSGRVLHLLRDVVPFFLQEVQLIPGGASSDILSLVTRRELG